MTLIYFNLTELISEQKAEMKNFPDQSARFVSSKTGGI